MGRPDRDPHGDPIPDTDGKMRTREGNPLGECVSNSSSVLLRVPDRSPDFFVTSATVVRSLARRGQYRRTSPRRAS